jgi:hypothetical protein
MKMNPRYTGLLLAAALALGACGKAAGPAPLAFPGEPSGGLEITYPLDETLFPPEIVAPTFVWSEETEGVEEWMVLLRFDSSDEVLRFPATEPRWRPSEADWAGIKERSVERDAEVAVVGIILAPHEAQVAGLDAVAAQALALSEDEEVLRSPHERRVERLVADHLVVGDAGIAGADAAEDGDLHGYALEDRVHGDGPICLLSVVHGPSAVIGPAPQEVHRHPEDAGQQR